jgi:hypothetical protein
MRDIVTAEQRSGREIGRHIHALFAGRGARRLAFLSCATIPQHIKNYQISSNRNFWKHRRLILDNHERY